MKKITYEVSDPYGIHARPAALLVRRINEFKCSVLIEKDGRAVDAKSILALMSLGIKQHDTITIVLDGEDEEYAAQEMMTYL